MIQADLRPTESKFLIMNGFSLFVPYQIDPGNSNGDGGDKLIDIYESMTIIMDDELVLLNPPPDVGSVLGMICTSKR